MARPVSTQTLLSPAELSFIHSSLSLDPPIRPDLRKPTDFRPLVAETDILATTNGSARICLSDGTEAIVGVKAEVEKTPRRAGTAVEPQTYKTATDADVDDGFSDVLQLANSKSSRPSSSSVIVDNTWLEISIEIPGYRDDDPLPVFLSSMITETLVADGSLLTSKLYINARWHWKLFVDILLLSPPLSYPLPLLSLTTHLALLDAKLPRLTSEKEDDPMFDDDWDAAVPLYSKTSPTPADQRQAGSRSTRPPITLLIMTVGTNILFDPSKEELAVADAVFAVSVAPESSNGENGKGASKGCKLLAVRMIDPPSRQTPPGVPNSLNPTASTAQTGLPTQSPGIQQAGAQQANIKQIKQNLHSETEKEKEKGNLWSPPRGGVKRDLIARVIEMVVGEKGVAMEVLEGLAGAG